MTDMTAAMATFSGRVEAIEKATDHLTNETRATGDAARRLVEIAESAHKLAQAQYESRGKWLERIWMSQPLQMLMVGIVVIVLNFFGMSYIQQQSLSVALVEPSAEPALPSP